jgi:hypothetical protein
VCVRACSADPSSSGHSVVHPASVMSFSSFGLVIPSRRVVEDVVGVVEEEGSSISGGGGGDDGSSNDTGGASPCSRVDASGGHDNESQSSEGSPSPSLRWDVYTSAAHPEFEAEVGVYTSAPTLDDMLGFNNTGNVCVWPSEEVGLPAVESLSSAIQSATITRPRAKRGQATRARAEYNCIASHSRVQECIQLLTAQPTPFAHMSSAARQLTLASIACALTHTARDAFMHARSPARASVAGSCILVHAAPACLCRCTRL